VKILCFWITRRKDPTTLQLMLTFFEMWSLSGTMLNSLVTFFLYYSLLIIYLFILPLLSSFLFLFLFFLFFIFIVLLCLWYFAEDYEGRIVYAGTKLVILLLWKVPWIAILSYSLLSVWSSLLVSIKAFLTVSMIVGNFIDVYLFGMIAVLIEVLLYLLSFGLIIRSFPSSILPPSLSSSLSIPRLLEPFSSFPQPFTSSNRLSTNMLRGSSSTPSLPSFPLSCGMKSSITSMSILMFLLIVFYPEIPNSSTQLFISVILPFEYSMIAAF